jgi:nitroreductase
MEEEARTMEVWKAIQLKRAVREFSSQPLTAKEQETILNAGRRAQSAKNTQPWTFIAIQNATLLSELSQLGTYAGHLADAPFAVAILTPDPGQRWSIMFDAGQAAAYMQLAAWDMGIGSCPATIYQPEMARDLLQFPDDLELNVALSFGYPKDPDALTDPPRQGGRKPLREIVHIDRWSD